MLTSDDWIRKPMKKINAVAEKEKASGLFRCAGEVRCGCFHRKDEDTVVVAAFSTVFR